MLEGQPLRASRTTVSNCVLLARESACDTAIGLCSSTLTAVFVWSDCVVEEVEESQVSSAPLRWMDVTTTWHDARDSNPRDGDLVLAAVAGRYRTESGERRSSEQDFWFVLPMHFRHLHPVGDTDRVLHDRYLDADRVVRRPFGANGDEDEVVTHWAEMPTLPGIGALELTGAAVSDALAAAQKRLAADA